MLRTLFISLFQIYLPIGLIISIAGFSQNSEAVAWWSSMFAHLFPISWFLFLRSGKLTNHSFASLLITIGTGICTLIALADGKMTDLGLTPFFWSSISLFFWLVYHLFLNKVPKAPIQLKAGDQLDDRFPKNPNGPSLICFQQGKWSPFCTFQEKSYLRDLKSGQNLKVHFITDPHTNFPINKWKGSVPFLKRKDHGSSDSWIPSCLLYDENGRIITFYQAKDLRNRPQLSYFLRFLDEK